jgi:nucleoside-diphosphate-sugar epimerase
MRIFVTGATGFIGSHFINATIAAGHEVVALRNRGSICRIEASKSVEWIDGELGQCHAHYFEGCDVLVHLAAAGVLLGQAKWEDCYKVNVVDSLAIWLMAKSAGVKRFVIAGSCFEYGKAGEFYSEIPVQSPLLPTGPYHASKASASLAAIAFGIQNGLEVAILRPFHVYGEGEAPERFWPALKSAALSGVDFPMTKGDQIRDFTPVAHVVKVFLDAAVNWNLIKGEPAIENIGTGNPQTLLQFAEYWWDFWGAQGNLLVGALPHRVGETMRYVPEICSKCRM